MKCHSGTSVSLTKPYNCMFMAYTCILVTYMSSAFFVCVSVFGDAKKAVLRRCHEGRDRR